ncbi:hypothetical protein [Streptosporangium sp. NPDC000396]|uniref:hypothetical protein n=1 Tax=Streptosporangium sp. NPDC000396 TaxID=3366185 RepID=UPI0036793E52
MEGESYEDQVQLRRWCEVTEPIVRVGMINLIGLPALVKAEIQWGLFAHSQIKAGPPGIWPGFSGWPTTPASTGSPRWWSWTPAALTA